LEASCVVRRLPFGLRKGNGRAGGSKRKGRRRKREEERGQSWLLLFLGGLLSF
jgi:hypothetical protein